MFNYTFNANGRMRLHSLTLLAIAICGGMIGCNESQKTEASKDKPKTSDLPKLKFHQPADFSSAVARLSELMTIIQSDFSMPAPKKFKVLEVIHGTGSSAHSHYYLADSKNHDDHGHDNVESSERIHELEIDSFTELTDIIRWLPKIAGDTDMERATWDQVNEISKSLETLLDDTKGELVDEELRKAIKAEGKTFNELVSRLKILSDGLKPDTE